MGDHKRSGKKAVNRHQTQSKTSASNQERAIEKVTRQQSKTLIVQDEIDYAEGEPEVTTPKKLKGSPKESGIPHAEVDAEMKSYLDRMNPTYAIRFFVLMQAVSHIRKFGDSPVTGMTAEQVLTTACKVTGLTGDVFEGERLERALLWLHEETKRGVMACPSCHKVTVLPLLPEHRAMQTDSTTHVCHFYAGGCDRGFCIDAAAAAVSP